MTISEAKNKLLSPRVSALFCRIYPNDATAVDRYCEALDAFADRFGRERHVSIFSSPGRTELGGNHTDHNGGRVLAASVDKDMIAVVSPRNDGVICVHSQDFGTDTLSLSDRDVREEKGKSVALIRGVARGFVSRGYEVGGFDAYTESRVPKGSGISSSAAFEVLLGTILNHLYNDSTIPPIQIAQICQEAEQVDFGKPCGLMDQVACAMGGVSSMDFQQEDAPVVRPVDVSLSPLGCRLCLVRLPGDHADLTDLYARIPAQMKQVAAFFGKDRLCQVSHETLLSHLPQLRRLVGDAATLAALHFCGETKRVGEMEKALREGDGKAFLALVTASGHSSFEALRNVWIPKVGACQDASLALTLAAEKLGGCGAWRIHGGGFGGTTLNFVPQEKLDDFCSTMNQVFGKDACMVIAIRPVGPVRVL